MIFLFRITDESIGDKQNFKEKAWKLKNAQIADRNFKSG